MSPRKRSNAYIQSEDWLSANSYYISAANQRPDGSTSMNILSRFLTVLALCFMFVTAVQSETARETRDRVNRNTVYVVGGSLTGTNSALVWDMAKLMDSGYDLRVLPIAGRGSMRTTEDILYLRGVDVGTVQADALDFFIDLKIYPNLQNNLRYISSLHNEEVHIVVRRDSGIENLSDLKGKKVNFGPPTSGTFLTASVVFDRVGVDVEAQTDPYDFGLQKLMEGEIDAFVRVAGAPTSFLKDISWESLLKLIPVDSIGEPYEEAVVTSEQYPGLIADGESINTIATPSLLVAYNHPEGSRRDRVEKFASAFREKLPELQSGGSFHEKWKEVDPNATVGGWIRWGSSAPDS